MIAIYGKKKNSKERFRPFDYAKGIFVINRMYMSMWSDEQSEHVQKLVDYMNEHNPDFTFEKRKVD